LYTSAHKSKSGFLFLVVAVLEPHFLNSQLERFPRLQLWPHFLFFLEHLFLLQEPHGERLGKGHQVQVKELNKLLVDVPALASRKALILCR